MVPAPVRRVGALVLVALAAACGGDDPAGPAATSTTTPAGGDGAATLGDELADTEEGRTELVQLALELLVVPDDLGAASFTDAGYAPPEGPNACGVDVDAELPPSVLVGTALTAPDGQSIVEELRVYGDVAAAEEAFAGHRDALACGTDGAGTTFTAPVDVNDVVGADAAAEVGAVVEDEGGVRITALVGDAVLTFAVSVPPATATPLDPREVAAFGVGKVLAALEAG